MKNTKNIEIILLIMLTLAALTGCSKKTDTINLSSASDDEQPYWNIFGHPIAAAENGYYYLDNSGTDSVSLVPIYYMDSESGESIILCGKADCKHNSTDCNAILDKHAGYSGQALYYYQEMLYVICDDDATGLSYLEQIAPDGSYRRRLFDIGAESTAYCLVFHNQSVYIYQRQGTVSGYEKTTATIRCRSLDGKEDTVIYEYTGDGAVIYAVKSYGDKLFFILEEESRAGTEEHSERIYKRKGVFAYDYNTKQVSNVCNEEVCDYTVDADSNTIWYYVFNDGMYKKNLSETKSKKIYSMKDKETNICQISFDGTYLYLSNEQYYVFFYQHADTYLYVLDTDGNELNRIETDGMYSTYFGDDKYVFNMGSFGTGKLRYIRKSEILTANKWE
jgi:hypothetical protein